jgi:hypothetical protein
MSADHNLHDRRESDSQGRSKVRYERPELRRLGSVRELTLGGSGSTESGGPGKPHGG